MASAPSTGYNLRQQNVKITYNGTCGDVAPQTTLRGRSQELQVDQIHSKFKKINPTRKTWTGALTFTIEGDRISVGTVSAFLWFY